MSTSEVHTRVLFQIDLDLDLSKNPIVRDFFVREEAKAALSAYFKVQDIKIVSTSANGAGVATHIEIRGPHANLSRFVDDWLADDAPGGVYTLLYR
jgi:hypothetical protein